MIATALAAVSRLISGATVQWHCDPNGEAQRIYFGNHSSHLDFIVIWSALPARLRRYARPVAGRDYWEQGAVRRYLASQVFHAVLIERGNAASDNVATARASIQRMADEMADRHSLIVFPEGTRSLNGEVGKFKSGLYHLACLRPDAELIPVHLENLNRILPKGETLPVPMLSRVVFGPRLHTSVDEGKEEFLAKARAALIQLRAIS
jgi:1-acyl-sn-glycerol-3-phosphate acyltransferase